MQSEIRAAFESIMAEHPDGVVSIVDAYGNTGSGMASTLSDPLELAGAGSDGDVRAVLKCSAATLVFAGTDIITVDDTPAQVVTARKDGQRALWSVEYTLRA